MDQKKGKSRIRGVIILVLLAVMLVSGAMSIHSWIEDKRTREEYERLGGGGRGGKRQAAHKMSGWRSWPGRLLRSRPRKQ